MAKTSPLAGPRSPAALACARRSRHVLLAALALGAGPALAQEGSRKPDQPARPAEHRPPPWDQRAGLFLGATLEDKSDPESGFTLGLDYEWRFHHWYGIGGLGQLVAAGNRTGIIGPAFFLHPVGTLRMTLAPAAERAEDDWYLAFRLGFEYDLSIRPRWVIAPSLSLDFSRGRRLYVLGVSAGRIF